jgi:hypothetical protein
MNKFIVIVISLIAVALSLLAPMLVSSYLAGWAISLTPEIIQKAQFDAASLTPSYLEDRIGNYPTMAFLLIALGMFQALVIGSLCAAVVSKK